MIVRAAAPDDVATVHALEIELFGPDAWTLAMVGLELRSPDRMARVAVDGALVVGYVVLLTIGTVADLNRIAVNPLYHGRGVATRLLTSVLDSARELRVARVLLEVGEGNTEAIAFYQSSGFVEVARRERYYRDGGAALVMELQL